jgi:hypothetical protein
MALMAGIQSVNAGETCGSWFKKNRITAEATENLSSVFISWQNGEYERCEGTLPWSRCGGRLYYGGNMERVQDRNGVFWDVDWVLTAERKDCSLSEDGSYVSTYDRHYKGTIRGSAAQISKIYRLSFRFRSLKPDF